MPTIPFPFTALPIPQGLIQVWSGTIAGIPQGWQLCDGTNGSPNLQDKFVRGINTAIDQPGSIGGQDIVTLSQAELPVHNHTTVAYSHTHKYTGSTSNGIGGAKRTTGNESDTKTTDNIDPPNQFTLSTGGSGSHNNIPPFFEIAYIIKK
ncbi:MAG: hypothetical protein V3V41_02065 [Candidatus Heimdallarchaeota archaeon]